MDLGSRFAKCCHRRSRRSGKVGESGCWKPGADRSGLGHCEPWKTSPGWDSISKLPKRRWCARQSRHQSSMNSPPTRLPCLHRDQHSKHHALWCWFGRAGVETARAEMRPLFWSVAAGQVVRSVCSRAAPTELPKRGRLVHLLSIYALVEFSQIMRPIRRPMAAVSSVSRRCAAEMRHARHPVINISRPDPMTRGTICCAAQTRAIGVALAIVAR